MHLLAKILFVVVGLAFSVFYAWKAVAILVDTENEFIKRKMRLLSWWFHQLWLNFVGSAVGWAAAYYYVFHRLLPICCYSFKIDDTVPILIALLGITGLLPYTLGKLTSVK
jgi:hypothetical protein